MKKSWSLAFCTAVMMSKFAIAQNAPCGISKVIEWKSATYPPIAKAAHVSGAVVALVLFDHEGNPVRINMTSGPEMLREATRTSISRLRVNAFEGVRECPVVVHFEIGDCDRRTPYPSAELPARYVCAEPLILYALPAVRAKH